MPPERFATLVNLTGFLAGLTLYAMLLVMVLRNPEAAMASPARRPDGRAPSWARGFRHEPLLAATAALGLVWNIGAFGIYGLEDLGLARPPAVAAVLAFVALGFLPAVVVHAALRPAVTERVRMAAALVGAGYLLSTLAGVLQVAAARDGHAGPSAVAFRLLVFGFGAIVVLLAAGTRRHARARRTLLLAALAVFAVSALHLTQHEALRDSWTLEIVGHHASIPLALAILYQDYPFALADLFLKRALVVVLILAASLAGYAVAIWLLPASRDPWLAATLFALGLGVAMIYPFVTRAIHWFVDAIVLRRADYAALHAAVADAVAEAETPEDALRESCRRLVPALAARDVGCWSITDDTPVPVETDCARGGAAGAASVARAHANWSPFVRGSTVWSDARKTDVVVIVPTTEPPRFAVSLGGLAGGRRVLSDDRAMLADVARTLARRIDLLRLEGERLARRVREADMRQLATEAELRALRAQINPHFLFNALTTVGYLIQTSPEVALEKLVHLTGLLRRVLGSEGEFTTLGHELELVRLYLDIEHARFEERLRVDVRVPEALLDLPIPTFALQPLVENAVTHGIAPAASGGLIEIRATLEAARTGQRQTLVVTVRDTGAGVRTRDPRHPGVGLSNLERRLRHHYGADGSLKLVSTADRGTVVTLRVPAEGLPTPAGRSATEVTGP